MDQDEVDFAFAAWREEGRWSVALLPPRAVESLGAFIAALRQLTGEGGAVGFVAVEEEYFVGVRIPPDGVVRLVLSDLNAAYEWALAEEAADILDIELPEDEDDLDEVEPAGDLGFVADFGMPADDVELLLSDPELYPDEQVSSIAMRLGFGDQFKKVVDSPRSSAR